MAKEKSKAEKLQEKLTFSYTNLFDITDDQTMKKVQDFNENYKKALNIGKTEREFTKYTIDTLEKAGFVCLEDKDKLVFGDKVYKTVHNKGIIAAVIGSEALTEGLLIVGSHIDSPRLDLKPNPLLEKDEIAFFKTHYYGGVKKYHWLSIPLALHGVVITKEGQKINISVGEKEDDPVFTISDLLIHLSREQLKKPAVKVVEGEQLEILIGSRPYPDKEINNRFKLGVLELLYQEYGFTERDLLTAEIEVVPAFKARDIGFDRSFVGSYGQDDRVCAYTSLQAFLDSKAGKKTQILLFTDKEEIGSTGNTGAQSQLYYFILNELHAKTLGREPGRTETQRMMQNSYMLSSDVSAAYDPKFPEVFEPQNSCHVNYGICFNKYTGSAGKGGTSDASAEYFNKITRLMDENDIPWQVCELGKIDAGGGGTIAMYYANEGMNVIDCGVGVLAMHSCYEVTSKLDNYYTYQAYKTFYEKA